MGLAREMKTLKSPHADGGILASPLLTIPNFLCRLAAWLGDGPAFAILLAYRGMV